MSKKHRNRFDAIASFPALLHAALQAAKGKGAKPGVAAFLAHAIASLPTWRQTLTFDNGTEFACHYDLHGLGIETFFCDTYSPWQKGDVENAIGRLCRTLSRKPDLAALSEEQSTRLVQVYNNTPRKYLSYQMPAEIVRNHLLHFKCKATASQMEEWR